MAVWSQALRSSDQLVERLSGLLPIRPDPIRDGAVLIGLLCGVGQAVGMLPNPIDAELNWIAGGSIRDLYPAHWDHAGQVVFVYPPPLAILASALRLIPFDAYLILVTTLLFACLWYCAGRWTFAILLAGVLGMMVPLFGPLRVPLGYALNGNIQLVLAAAVVVSLRHPAGWALPILTKIGPGIGLVWHLVRREWGSVAIALAITAAIVAITLLLAPGTWLDYAGFVQRSSDLEIPLEVVPIPWAARLAMSGMLIAWGALTDRAWTVPIGVGWAMPALYPWSFLAIWLGAIRLSGIDRIDFHVASVRRELRSSAAVGDDDL